MHHPLKHINQYITRRLSKDKDSTVNKTEYHSKRNPTGKPRWARQTAKAPGSSLEILSGGAYACGEQLYIQKESHVALCMHSTTTTGKSLTPYLFLKYILTKTIKHSNSM